MEYKVRRCLLKLIDNLPVERIAKREQNGFSRKQCEDNINNTIKNSELVEKWVWRRFLCIVAILLLTLVLTNIYNQAWLVYPIALCVFYVLLEIFPHMLYTVLFGGHHRSPRLAILLFINYFEIAFLFAALYSSRPDIFHGAGYWLHSLQASFGYMTSFQKAYIWPASTIGLFITLIQTLIGWFFNVVIISRFIGLLTGNIDK